MSDEGKAAMARIKARRKARLEAARKKAEAERKAKEAESAENESTPGYFGTTGPRKQAEG
jgi:hypothetical protein